MVKYKIDIVLNLYKISKREGILMDLFIIKMLALITIINGEENYSQVIAKTSELKTHQKKKA